jgi:hypothetical protein
VHHPEWTIAHWQEAEEGCKQAIECWWITHMAQQQNQKNEERISQLAEWVKIDHHHMEYMCSVVEYWYDLKTINNLLMLLSHVIKKDGGQEDIRYHHCSSKLGSLKYDFYAGSGSFWGQILPWPGAILANSTYLDTYGHVQQALSRLEPTI